jgi:cytosine/adenosine deaminase-related metal-dependent hydrolase
VAEAIEPPPSTALTPWAADRVGSLEFGKSADLVILNVHDYREMEQNFGIICSPDDEARGVYL